MSQADRERKGGMIAYVVLVPWQTAQEDSFPPRFFLVLLTGIAVAPTI